MPGTATQNNLTTMPGSDLRQGQIQYNQSVFDLQMNAFAGSIDTVWAWSSLAANSLQALGRGSTDTNIATGAFRFIITGQAASEAKAAVTAGTAIGAQTVPADKWALWALDVATGGTITVPAAAANTTGYATEALAIAALPQRVSGRARLGYITVKTASGQPFVAATDGLAGGSSGNVASITNYYPYDGAFAPTGVAYGPNGVVTSGGQGVEGGAAAVGTGAAWSGGRNGVLISPVLAIGSTDTRVSNAAFTFNCNGACNIAKAAVAAGTALSAQTVPADQWAIYVLVIDGAGTITYLPGPANATTGYGSEQAAKNDLYKIFPASTSSTGKAQMGYVTLKTKAATAWIAGTDAFAGGSSGNPASVTNYYSTAQYVLRPGPQAGTIGGHSGTALTSINL